MALTASTSIFLSGIGKRLLVLFALGIMVVVVLKTIKPPATTIHVNSRAVEKLSSNHASNKMFEKDDLLQQMKHLYKKQAISRKSILNNSSAQITHALLSVYAVPEVFCHGLARIGALGDGGKWICSPFNVPRENCTIMSLGTANDISFESELQNITGNRCKLYAVDQSEQQPAVIKALASINGKFIKGKLGAVQDATANLYTFAHVMQKNGIKSIEILKIDIEGGEVDVIPPLIASQNVCQILIEIHSDLPKRIPFMKEIAKRGYYLFAHELNPYYQQLSEYSFIHSSCLEKYSATVLASYLS